MRILGTSGSQSLKWDDIKWRKDSEAHEFGSSIQTAGDLRLLAGHDVNACGASVTSKQGALVATAGNDVTIARSIQYGGDMGMEVIVI